MPEEKSNGGNRKFNLFAFLLHPAVSIIGGIFSVLAALLFGGFRLSRRKKRATETDARITASRLGINLEEVRHHLEDFRAWLKEQKEDLPDMKEAQIRYAGLTKLYSEWTSHERMEKILGTVQYDPRIGMNVSNGLHELRSLNMLMETVLRDEAADEAKGGKLAEMDGYAERAIGFFSYTGKDTASSTEATE